MSVNKRIELVRNSENLSRKEFGEKIKKTPDAVYNLERGRASIHLETINLICESFYINKNWLLSGEGEMYSINEENINIGNAISKVLESKELSELVYQLVELSEDKIKVLNDLVKIFNETQIK